MIQGLYAAASGMMAVEERQSVIANNIANVSTPGFKRQLAVDEGFYGVFNRALMNSPSAIGGGPGGGIRIAETYTDVAAGAIQTTGNPLDVALVGPGYLSVETPDGEQFTRNGRMSLDPEGFLCTGDGLPVLDADGDRINCGDGGTIQISGDGSVKVDGGVVGTLRVVEFEDPHALTRKGHYLYSAGEEAVRAPAASTQVVGESLEGSNVQLPAEIIHMMAAVRAYAANQMVISTADETATQLINQVGMG
jgi:flagellar basal-body rod protein FlgF